MKFQLQAKFLPLLKKEEDGRLSAVLISQGTKESILGMEDGVSIKIRNEDIEIDSKALSSTLFFDKEGKLVQVVSAEIKPITKSGKIGCLVRPEIRFR